MAATVSPSPTQALFHPDRETRLKAVEQASAVDTPWHWRGLLLAAALGERDTCRVAFEHLGKKAPQLVPFLLQELDGPVPKARALALKLLGEHATLSDIVPMLPCLLDPSVDVRDSARRALLAIAERSVERWSQAPIAPAEVETVMQALGKAAATTDTSARKALCTLLLRLSLVAPTTFWRVYRGLHERTQQNIHLEFLSSHASWTLVTLYRGFLIGDEEIEQRMAALLERHLANDDSNRHLDQIRLLTGEEQGRLALALDHHGLMRFFTDTLEYLKADCRHVLLDMVEYLDLARFARFLERCAEQDDIRLRTRALRLLGREQPQATHRRAADLLRSHDVREVLVGLELAQGEHTRDTLMRVKPLLNHPSELVRATASRVVFAVSKTLFFSRYDKLSDPQRAEVLAYLRRLNPRLPADLVAEWEQTTSDDERVKLAQMLANLAAEEDLETYCDQLQQGAASRVRATLARLFGRLRNPVHRLRRLVPLLYDPETRVRANALDELPAQSPPAVIERVKELAQAPHPRERANALRRLIEWGHSEYEVSLIRMIEAPDPNMRASGLWTLGELRLVHLIDALHAALSDRNPIVRANAVTAWGKCAPDDEVRGLERFLRDAEPRVRQAARDALRKRLHLIYEIET